MFERVKVWKCVRVVAQTQKDLQFFRLLSDLQQHSGLVPTGVGAHNQFQQPPATIAQTVPPFSSPPPAPQLGRDHHSAEREQCHKDAPDGSGILGKQAAGFAENRETDSRMRE